MSGACPICHAVADERAGKPVPSCPECAHLLRWFRGYFSHDRSLALELITPETTFNELGAESLDYMNWLLEAEEKLGVSIPDEEAERIRTVGEFLRVLHAGGAAWPPDCQFVLVRKGGCFREYSWMAVKGGKPQASPKMLGVDPGLYDRELDG